MTVLWTSDACKCEIEIDKDINFVSWFFKCEFHKNINDNALLNVVLTHNNNFNRRFTKPNASEKRQLTLDKRNEVARIRALGGGIRR